VVGPADDAGGVPTTVEQEVRVAPVEVQYPAIVRAIRDHIERYAHVLGSQRGGGGELDALSDASRQALADFDTSVPVGYKSMVFLPANDLVDLYSAEFRADVGPEVEVVAMSGSMDQKKRTRAFNTFRKGSNIVMFTSDASARGVDYPNVTGVVQVGYTGHDEYRQRLGRTARSGKWGQGILLVDPIERTFVASNPAIPEGAFVDASADEETHAFRNAKGAKRAFRSWLGFVASHWKSAKLPPAAVLDMAQRFGAALGADTPEAKIRDKLRIK